MAEAAAQAFPFSFEALNRLTTKQKVGAMVAVALAVALLAAAWLWVRTPSYGILFSNLSERDGGQIVGALQQQNIPYKLSEGGGAILVPATQVHDIRLRLASQGLPKGGFVGFEVMETQKLGASQFLEQVNYQRALEGELSRTIATISAVQGARVHLAIPKQTAFLRDEMKPSASVLLNLQPGRGLEPAQVAGIVHLVSSSVPQLAPAAVSVVDQNGNLISRKDSAKETGLDPNQSRFTREIEETTARRVEAILAPVVGEGNVKAQVVADVDFSTIDQVAETYRPNPTPETAIRSQQTAESGTTQPNAAGVPGALSNQPPVPATAPVTAPPAPGTPATGPGGTTVQPLNYTRNATTNYELDKTVRHTRGQPGVIRRLSVAVVLNHKKAAGKSVALSEAELKQANDLVREAMGFNKDRGDTLNVVNAPFTASDAAAPATPVWKDPEMQANGKEALKWVAFIVLAFLLWTRVFKPLFDRLVVAAAEARETQAAEPGLAMAGGEGHHVPGERSFDDKLATAREIARKDPKLVAALIRDWMSGGEQR
ncbi:MAG: flagellar M-ring protein FliF [Rhodocyclaceae bacterium]|nr:flagellar M-ring protein FliF [Rhodocyclaceae bacterium]